MEGWLFKSHQNRNFLCLDDVFKKLLPIFIYTGSVHTYVSRQGKGMNRRKQEKILSI